jgi:hypothetical protein
MARSGAGPAVAAIGHRSRQTKGASMTTDVLHDEVEAIALAHTSAARRSATSGPAE